METKYYRLKDTSGTFWAIALGISFVRHYPVELESSPELKELLAKGVIIEVDESEFKEAYGTVEPKQGVDITDPEKEQPVAALPAETGNENLSNIQEADLSGEVLPEKVLQDQTEKAEPISEGGEPSAELTAKEEAVVADQGKEEQSTGDNLPGDLPAEYPETKEVLQAEPEPEVKYEAQPEKALDRNAATELLNKAEEKGVVTVSRGWYNYGDITLGKGVTLAVDKLMAEPGLAKVIQTQLSLV